MLIFDIETEALSLDELRPLMPPFDSETVEGLVTGEFDPTRVKTGNLKDEAKKEAKIAEARAVHESARANSAQIIADAQIRHEAKFVESAALNAVTARVLVIGYHNPDKGTFSLDDNSQGEAELLSRFWSTYKKCRVGNRSLIGLNIHDFDLPFLVRRSWMLGVDVPDSAMTPPRMFWDSLFIDLRKIWLLGQHSTSGQSNFDFLGKAFGTGGKNGQSGKDFARLWRTDREAAKAYLQNDLKQPAEWARRMGILK